MKATVQRTGINADKINSLRLPSTQLRNYVAINMNETHPNINYT